MRTTVRCWRWRRNTLRRGTDRVEAWVVLLAGVVLWLGAPLAGVLAGMNMADRAARPGAGRHQVTAVLVRNAPSAPSAGWGWASRDDVRVDAQVRWTAPDGAGRSGTWTAPDGAGRSGTALVRPGSPAGQHVTVWLDQRGTIQQDPADPAQAQARAVVFGLMTAGAAALGVLGARWAGVLVIDRRRAAELDREWAAAGRTWGHHPA